MPQVVQQGQINTAALQVADLYVQIVPPQLLINGVATNVVGVVGVASWGSVGGAPGIVGGYGSHVAQYGPMVVRPYDGATATWNIYQQGNAPAIKFVRVTDGTDIAATVAVQTNCLTLTSKFTGSLANKDVVSIGPGSAANSFKVVVVRPGQVGEVFDNITGTGNALWQSIATAINNGLSGLRGPSGYLVATAGAGTAAPTTASYSLSGGTDGASGVNSSAMLGQDVLPRTGMYALRGTGCSVGMLTDVSDSTTWAAQIAFGLGEGIYMVACGPSGDTINNATAVKASAGIDSYAMKLMFGDWVYFNDSTNGQIRLVSPQAFVAGMLGNLAPNQSTLNKPMQGIVGTQKAYTGVPYTGAELQVLANAGIDVICNPIPAGSSFGCRNGRNTSSNASIRGDNYTRMTNFLAFTIAAGVGKYVGTLQTTSQQRKAKVTLDAFFAGVQQQGLIGDVNGPPAWKVQLDANNNPFNRVSLGYEQADIQVTYQSVVEYFIVNMQGGQTVSIDRTTTSVSTYN
jgi:hypothetical protein